MTQLANDGGNKFDGGKNRVDLVDPMFIQGTANAMTFGATKYGDNNWRGGIKQSRLYGAILRHLFAYWLGETNDPESNLHPLDHAAAGLMMLMRHAKDPKYMDLDDRPGVHEDRMWIVPEGALEGVQLDLRPGAMTGIKAGLSPKSVTEPKE